jgi:hypothetical protein
VAILETEIYNHLSEEKVMENYPTTLYFDADESCVGAEQTYFDDRVVNQWLNGVTFANKNYYEQGHYELPDVRIDSPIGKTAQQLYKFQQWAKPRSTNA